MRIVKKVIQAKIGNFSEISSEEQLLLKAASAVRLNAQAPYSNFLVGAAVLSEKGTVYLGCNVERCSWTQTTHAEQNAIDNMVAHLGPAKIKIVALVGGPAGKPMLVPPKKSKSKTKFRLEDAAVPCGHCLQIIWENCFEDTGVKLITLLSNGQVSVTTIGDALPIRFGPRQLELIYRKIKKSR